MSMPGFWWLLVLPLVFARHHNIHLDKVEGYRPQGVEASGCDFDVDCSIMASLTPVPRGIASISASDYPS